MMDGVIRWKPPLYPSFGALCYELIDADDHEEETILSVDEEHEIDVNAFYEGKGVDLADIRWRIRIKESHRGNHAFSPVIGYDVGDIPCSKFAKYAVFSGDIEAMDGSLKFPKWEPPPKPDILDKIKRVELEDHGPYWSVPTTLDPESDSVLRVLCFSDTHTKHKEWRMDALPPADLLLHAGDFSFDGHEGEVVSFEEWGRFIANLNVDESKNEELYAHYYGDGGDEAADGGDAAVDDMKWDGVPMAERKYKYLVCIAGNHEMTFDVKWYDSDPDSGRYHKLIRPPPDAEQIKKIVTESAHWHYLEDSAVRVFGLTIYGAPWQPFFFNWAFQLSRGRELNEKWKLIREDTDILLTHGPPYCHGDRVSMDRVKHTGNDLEYTGDRMLMNRVIDIGRIQFHVFGHVHSGVGCSVQDGVDTTFVNAASLNAQYQPTHKPIVFYIERKDLD